METDDDAEPLYEGPLKGRGIYFEPLSADFAFGRLCRLHTAAAQHRALAEVVAAVQRIEEGLLAIEGEHEPEYFRELRAQEEDDDTYTHYDDDEFLGWLDLERSKEELAEAFVVILQGQVNALEQAALRVYEAARDNDRIIVEKGRGELGRPPILAACWDVADYIKHRDAWPEDLGKLLRDSRQKRTFEALEARGFVQRHERTDDTLWTVERRLVLRVIGAEDTPASQRLTRLTFACKSYCCALTRLIQGDFEQLDSDVRRARSDAREAWIEKLKNSASSE